MKKMQFRTVYYCGDYEIELVGKGDTRFEARWCATHLGFAKTKPEAVKLCEAHRLGNAAPASITPSVVSER